MKKFISWEEYYANSYHKHAEEVARLERLLDIEERKLFDLIQLKKYITRHETQKNCKSGEAEIN